MTPAAAKIPNDQLDSLVAPIALYPDPLLAQTLAASTYPLEVIQLQQWLLANKNLKDKALSDAVQKQNWDPSVQAMSAFPSIVKQLSENIKWTSELGNAFLAQQSDVMDAVQRMRLKAKNAGKLASNDKQKVETKTVEGKTVIVIEQADPKVVYVPVYNPTVVYGVAVYPYPAIYYPPPGTYALAFATGVAIGVAWSGGWGWGCGWGHNDVEINVNNNYVNNWNKTNINNISGNNFNRPSNLPANGDNKWQHNPQHRGGAPYPDSATASKFGGTASGNSLATRQANARQNQSALTSSLGAANRSAASSGFGNSKLGGGDRIGSRDLSRSSANSGIFGGGSGGFSGNSARANSSRGLSSTGGSRGGGKRRG